MHLVGDESDLTILSSGKVLVNALEKVGDESDLTILSSDFSKRSRRAPRWR